ncbi:eukaryotic translation initiation factor 4E [Piedraia hortae CBS 480.64]|uniref:Eukaryotic translation initiation factor 4E n=1 Tax=Piedraia hortae CBS 480.64 TaxID=1314780 RepID=A0A6A7BQB4_9PEZI|nr:eukaryotic translation initiation factor 4E [Piedraia hortae CBS 480.64]
MVTVFDDPANFNVKHQLQHTWTLWFTKPPQAGKSEWGDLLKEVISFDSVEEFWGVWNNITLASDLAQKSDYHLFKKGVRPEWEDPQNKNGGRWSYTFRTCKPSDDIWLNVVLAAIGEQLEDEHDNEVMGVVINIRKAFWRVGLWTRTNGSRKKGKEGDTSGEDGEARLKKIGKRFKDALQLPPGEGIEFSSHSDAAHSGSTRAKTKLTL